MRLKNKWDQYRRSVIALLLICGFFLSVGQLAKAATVTYQYDRITDVSGLPTDEQWHDYFIAWEDDSKSDTVWFTDYNWYTADGDTNIDVGGLTWMEYKSASKLPDSHAASFTSQDSLGHMQIKYAGKDADNGNSPRYYIRVSKVTGGYSYFTGSEPVSKQSEADTFTFQDKGEVFHIFVNVSGGADRYLTRDGDQLETSLSSSSSSDEYPLRVYRRTFYAEQAEGSIDIEGNQDKVEGKVTMYEYNWVNTVEEMEALTGDSGADGSQWQDVLLAWEDCDEDNDRPNDPDRVWYTKEIWFDNGKPNYENDDTGLDHEFYYWSNDTLGSDGYSSAYADSFVLSEDVGHFQICFRGLDEDNYVNGVKTADGKKIEAPKFTIRFAISQGNYAYLGNDLFVSDAEDAKDFTVQLFLDEGKKNNSDYYYGSVHIFRNKTAADDEYITRKGNRFDISAHNFSDDWEFPFRIYTKEPVEYDAIVQSFTIGAGGTYSIDRHLILKEGVTITVEDGGVLTVDSQLYSNGQIIVKQGGTVIVNEGGYIMPFSSRDSSGGITLDGGNLVILDGGKLLCDDGAAALEMKNGATVVNRGLLVVGELLSIRNNSILNNESTGVILLGGKIGQDRGSVGSLDMDVLTDYMTDEACQVFLAKNASIINKGIFCEPSEGKAQWYLSENSGFYTIDGGEARHR